LDKIKTENNDENNKKLENFDNNLKCEEKDNSIKYYSLTDVSLISSSDFCIKENKKLLKN